MGYKRNPKVYNLVFGDDTDYPGLEVQVRSLTMGQLFKTWTGDDTSNGAAATYDLLVERLVSWNLEEEDGTPVPTTREAIDDQDDDMVMAIQKQWLAAVRGVPAPLESGSDSGATSPVESMLTEIPSQSLAS